MRLLEMRPHRTAWLAGVILTWAAAGLAATPPPDSPTARLEAERLAHLPPVTVRGHIDHSGRKQQGRASYYAHHFTNRKMADGRRFNPNSNAAASKTLPFGTTAKVTNLKNGRSAVVTVEDRGPHVGDRIVDVTPKVADELDMKRTGTMPVVVSPIAVPQPDGAVKLGAGAAEVTTEQQRAATRTANALR
jgi:peptidoglycan lytic transglycosylase